jgi:drug/metabolite transporter (DMT)-like permease
VRKQDPVKKQAIDVTSDRRAIALATLAILLLTVMDAIIKSLHASFDAFQIMYYRTTVGLLCASALFIVLRPGLPDATQFRAHALRSGIMLATGLMFFYALGQMPLAELFVYTFTAPMFVAVFGTLLLKERLTKPVITGLALGFAGIVAIVATDPAARFGGGSISGLVAAVLSPITYALAMVLLRRQAGSEPVARIVFMQSLCIAAVMVPFLVWSTPLPQGIDVWKVVAVGVLGTTGNFILATAFSKAEAAKVAVSEYTGLIWAALIGYAFFNETPRLMVWAGAALVIAGCLAVARGRTGKPSVTPASPQDAV